MLNNFDQFENGKKALKKALLGQLLLEKELITKEQLEFALEKQKEVGEMLGVVLVNLGYIEQEDILLPIIAEQRGVNYIRFKHLSIPHDVVERVPAKVAIRYQVMPVSFEDDTLTIAMVRPFDVLLKDELSMLLKCKLNPILAGSSDILETIRKYYGVGVETIEQIMNQDERLIQTKTSDEAPTADLENIDSEATIGNFLNQVMLDAYHYRATDIHIEPFEKELIVRYRVDGVLQNVSVPEHIEYFKDSINSRIKIMSDLDITEKRRPQDGRFRMRIGEIELDLRVSFMPTPHGESAVLRILNTTQLLSFDDLDLRDDEFELLEGLIHKPHGIVFMTGPTGSGKTSTLYSCLSRINTVEKKIITIEDPVEYQLRSITQVQINPMIKLTFAKALRSILRHDPDVIMVGEVRDVETAEIAIQFALTGHLIFSTLHTNDAATGVTRLVNMGVEPYLINSTVECFIAQRLVRLVCPHCKYDAKVSPKMMKEFELETNGKSKITIVQGKGCKKCNNSGYLGRTSIYEFLTINQKIGDLVLSRASADQIKKAAMESGMRTLRQSGWEKVERGMTTPEEVLRVTQEKNLKK